MDILWTTHVYYVDAQNGVDGDAPKRGITRQILKTVRYAADWIEKGANSYEDKYLIEVNRAFMQAEVVEWVDYPNCKRYFPSQIAYNKENVPEIQVLLLTLLCGI